MATAHDTLDLGYDELKRTGGIDAALAGSDCRAEVLLAYIHSIIQETGDVDQVWDGIWHAAQTLALIDARGYSV
ncbi:hypothetical protein [Thiobacillus sp.]